MELMDIPRAIGLVIAIDSILAIVGMVGFHLGQRFEERKWVDC